MAHDDSTHTCACGGNCGCQDQEQYLVELKAEIAAVEMELIKIKTPADLVKA